MSMATITTKPGFDWGKVAWGRADSPMRPYCHGKIDDDDVPLMVWRKDGSMAQFCDSCIETWFG
jgi:hypothetical protein